MTRRPRASCRARRRSSTAPATENFSVASLVLGRATRDHLLAIYGFARLVDQLGDEVDGDRLAQLDWLEADLDRAYDGRARASADAPARPDAACVRSAARAVPAADRGEPPRPGTGRLPDLRRAARLLRPLRQPRRRARPARLRRRDRARASRCRTRSAPRSSSSSTGRTSPRTTAAAASTSRRRISSASASRPANFARGARASSGCSRSRSRAPARCSTRARRSSARCAAARGSRSPATSAADVRAGRARRAATTSQAVEGGKRAVAHADRPS